MDQISSIVTLLLSLKKFTYYITGYITGYIIRMHNRDTHRMGHSKATFDRRVFELKSLELSAGGP